MDSYANLYPWTLKHPVIQGLTLRARLAYVELLADAAAYPAAIDDKILGRLIRKDHRDTLAAAGLITENTDGTYTVVQPSAMHAPLGA